MIDLFKLKELFSRKTCHWTIHEQRMAPSWFV